MRLVTYPKNSANVARIVGFRGSNCFTAQIDNERGRTPVFHRVFFNCIGDECASCVLCVGNTARMDYVEWCRYWLNQENSKRAKGFEIEKRDY